jgi:hypothetical protein
MSGLNDSDSCRLPQAMLVSFNHFREPCNHPNLYAAARFERVALKGSDLDSWRVAYSIALRSTRYPIGITTLLVTLVGPGKHPP